MTGRAYAVAGGKGGVGKTTTVVNLGVMLRVAGHRVAVVDADLGMANVATVLGIDHEPTVHDVLAGDADTLDAVVEEPDGFGVVPGSPSLDGFAAADPEDLERVIQTLIADYDVVLVDTGAGLSFESVLPVGMTDGVLLVTTPDRAAIEDTAKTAEIVELAEGTVIGAVLTRARAETDVDVDAIAAQLGTDVLEVIPEDPAVQASIDDQKPLITLDPDSPAATAYRSLGNTLLERIDAEFEDRDDRGVEDAPSDPTGETDAGDSEHEPEHGDEHRRDDERNPEPALGDVDQGGDTPSERDESPPLDEDQPAGLPPDDFEAGPIDDSGGVSDGAPASVDTESPPETDPSDPLGDVGSAEADRTDPLDGTVSTDTVDDNADDRLDRSEADRSGTDGDGVAEADDPLGGLAEGSIGSEEEVEDLLEPDDPDVDSPEKTAGDDPTDQGGDDAAEERPDSDSTTAEDAIESLDIETGTEPGDPTADLDAEEEPEESTVGAGSEEEPFAAPDQDAGDGEAADGDGDADGPGNGNVDANADDRGRGTEDSTDVDAVVDAARGAAAISDEIDDTASVETNPTSANDAVREEDAADDDDDAVGDENDGIAPTALDHPSDPAVPDGTDASQDPGTESVDPAATEGEKQHPAASEASTGGPVGGGAEDEATTDRSVTDPSSQDSTEEGTDADDTGDPDDESEGGISIPEASTASDGTTDADETTEEEGEGRSEEKGQGESRGFLSRLLNPFG